MPIIYGKFGYKKKPTPNQLKGNTMKINFKANGSLIGAVECTYSGQLVILVWWKNQYVVSKYVNGCQEWVSGSYFNDLTNAMDEFHRKTIIWCT